jgi:hypothetical protein
LTDIFLQVLHANALGGSVGKAAGLRYSESSNFIDSGFARQLNNNLDIITNTGRASAVSRNFGGAFFSSIDPSVYLKNSPSGASGGFILYPPCVRIVVVSNF